MLLCDGLVAFAESQKGGSDSDAVMVDAELVEKVMKVYLPRTVQQIVPQLTRTGPSLV